MKISIIIPALIEAHGILGSLHSIARQQGEFEIIDPGKWVRVLKKDPLRTSPGSRMRIWS